MDTHNEKESPAHLFSGNIFPLEDAQVTLFTNSFIFLITSVVHVTFPSKHCAHSKHVSYTR